MMREIFHAEGTSLSLTGFHNPFPNPPCLFLLCVDMCEFALWVHIVALAPMVARVSGVHVVEELLKAIKIINNLFHFKWC